jgi:hypothetical protein
LPPIVTLFDELKLRIEPSDGGGHRVIANSQVGEAAGAFVLPFNDLELENFVLRVSRPRGRRGLDSGAIADARRFGGSLFDAIFQRQVRDLYHEALANARGSDRGLRVTLCLSGSPELMDVPWEYLYDSPSFLSVSAFTPVVRYLDLPRGYRPLRVEPPMRILAVVSSPLDYERLDVERERTKLEGALSGLIAAGAVVVDWLEQPSLSSLLRKLQSDTFHVLHYVGHGGYDVDAQQGVLLFEDANGNGRPTSGDELGTILHDFTSLRLAVLNACEGARTSRTDPFAGVAESLVQRDVPAVIAMQFEITDAAAVVFAEGFYRAIASGAPVDASLAAARLAIFAESSGEIEWGTPVLFMRVSDGRIFDVPEPAIELAEAVTPAAEPAPPVARAAEPVAPVVVATDSRPPGELPAGSTGRSGPPPAAPEPVRSGGGSVSGTSRLGARAGPFAAGAVAILVVLLVLGAILGGGGRSRKLAPASAGTRSGVATTGPGKITGTWIGTAGPLTFKATEVDRRGNTVKVYFTATSAVTARLSGADLTATEDNGHQTYWTATDEWPIPAETKVSDYLEFDLKPPAKSITIAFSTIHGNNPAFANGLEVKGIPVPG